MFEDCPERCSSQSVIESEVVSELLVQVASKLAIADVPEEGTDGIYVARC